MSAGSCRRPAMSRALKRGGHEKPHENCNGGHEQETERPRSSHRRSMPFPDRKSTRLNSSHGYISYAVFCLKKKKKTRKPANERRDDVCSTLHGEIDVV